MTALDIATLWANVEQGGRRDFLVTADARMSFADLGVAVRRWLAWFDACGVQPGERIVIRTANEFAAISGFLAALLDGVVPVEIAPDSPGARATAVIAATEAMAFVSDASTNDVVLPEGARLLSLEAARQVERQGWLRRAPVQDPLSGLPAPAGRPPRLPADTGGLAYILFTSGTTASPSGVQITRGNLFANLRTQIRVFEYDTRSRIFNDMILAHADGMIQGPVLALAAGCAIIRSGGFQLPTLEVWLSRVRAERATHVITVPTIWAMIDRFAKHDDYFDAPECRSLLSVAARLPDELWRRLETRFRRPVFNQYGLTETVLTALWAGPHPEMGGFGTIGRPVDCDARILDPDAAGQGELLLKGANVFPGYWRDAARTQASFTDDGWLRTGDLARQRPDGSFEMLGRLKTVIMMGGFLIRPDEIDEAMLRHPDVIESATAAMPDAAFEEVPVTAVVLARPVDEAALTLHARGQLESQKVPKRIIALAAIPRGDAGKAQLAALRAALAGAMDASPVAEAAGGAVAETVLAIAAEIFRVPPASIEPGAGAGTVAGWDSFSQLNFLLAVEGHFGLRIPASRVAGVRSIADVVGIVHDLRR